MQKVRPLSHGDRAYKWLVRGNYPTSGRGSLVGLEKPRNKTAYPGKPGTGCTDSGGRELAEMLWLLLMFGEEVTQMSPPIRKPWTCEGSRGNSGQEGSGGKGGVETWPRDVTCSSLSRRAPLFLGFVPSGRKSQRRVKQVEGVFTFSQFLLF